MRKACMLALLAAFVPLGCASPTEDDSDSTDQGYTSATGTPELAAGWATTPAFDGHFDAFGAPRGALASMGGGLVAFVEDFEAGSLAAKPLGGGAAIPIASEAHYRYGANLAADADGVLYDRSYYWQGSPVYTGIFFSSRAGGAFDKEVVDAKIPWTRVAGVCLASHRGTPIAVYATGAEIRIAERGAGPAWTTHSVDSSQLGSSFHGCAASGDDVFVLVGTGTFDFLRVARFTYAGGAWGAATIESISSAPKIASATIALAPSGSPRVAWADASSVHVATRSEAGTWSASALSTPFDASVAFSLALTGDVVVAGVNRSHPKVAGWSKDAIYVGGPGKPFALVYSPTSGSLRVNGAAASGGRVTVSAVESQYGGDYRFLTATGPL